MKALVPATRLWHCLSAFGLLVVLLLLVYAAIARPLMAKHEQYRSAIASLEQRLQRYQALIATRPQLERQLRRLEQDRSARGLFLVEKEPSLAATELRRKVKEVVQAAGGTLVSTQSLPEQTDEAFPRVTLKVQVQGDTAMLQRVLHALEAQRPLLFIDNMGIRAREIRRRTYRDRRSRRAQRARRPEPAELETRLTVGFELYGYLMVADGIG